MVRWLMFITRKFILKTKSLLTTLELYDVYDLNKHTLEQRFYDYILRTTNVSDVKDFTKHYRYLLNRFGRMRRLFANRVHKTYYDSIETRPLYTLLPEMPYDQTVITNYLGYNYKKYKILSASSNIETKPIKGVYKINPYSSLRMKLKFNDIMIYEHEELKYKINYKMLRGFVFKTSDNLDITYKDNVFYIKNPQYQESALMGSFTYKDSYHTGFSFALLKIEKEAELMTLITLGIIALINHKEVLAASAS